MTETIALAGHEVPRIGFGTLYLTQQRGFGPARADAVDLLREAARLGVRLFDTADSYGNGAAEEALRAALHPYDGLVVTSKGGFRHERLGAWTPDARPAHLRAALEGSLTRLGLETIALYQLHCPDRRVPYAESVGTLADLQKEGKIRHIGVSNVGLRELDIARREAEIVSVENPYNIRYRGGGEVLDACTRDGLVFLPWMPLGDGAISWRDPVLVRIAARHGATPAQVALAALLQRENVAAGAIRLDPDEMAQLWRG
jgi:aryl-alcohol dehydrogenase-like predicted oxidoreductase